MKIKKGLALILALAMIITLMPTMAFATTTNATSSDRVYVEADSLMPATSIYLKAGEDWDQVTVRVSLSLENATWTNTPVSTDNATITNGEIKFGVDTVATVDIDAKTANLTSVKFISAEDDTLVFEVTTDTSLAEDDRITLEFADNALTSGSDEGAVNAVIERDSSNFISTGTIRIAEVASGKTTAEVTGNVKTSPRGPVTGATIKITEVTVNAFDNNEEIKLTLPKNVTWDDVKVNGFSVITKGIGERTAEIKLPVTADDANIQSVTITPYINIGKDAAEGDIAVDLVGLDNVTDTDDLVIAAYGNESVEITTEEEVPTIVSGYEYDTKGDVFTISVTLKESMKDSLSAGRYVDFDLPEEVQICGQIEAKVNKKAKGAADVTDAVSIEGIGENSTTANYKNEDTSGFEFLVPGDSINGVVSAGDWETGKANTITFEIPVTVEAGFTGDITMNITGSKAGIEDTELVVATAEAPITVETTTTNVKNGVQTQTVADITITENFAGYMEDGDKLYLGIDTLGLTAGSAAFESFDSIEVTDGNLEIGRCKIEGDKIMIPIDGESTRVSTIELKGLTLVLNRTLPEGGYDLQATGDAVVKNANDDDNNVKGYNDGDFSDVAVTTEDYLVITTPADDAAGINATFTDGQASYTLNGQTVTMDVAPYIDSNNRMLVPIRYAANAMGVSDDNIQWNSYTQTGTISGAMGVVRVTVGSTNLITSNGTITMDTVAVNTNNRIYVPVRYIANALGASVSWDPATRTATFS